MDCDKTKKIEILKTHIAEYADFPKQGILFRDFFSVFKNAEALLLLQELIFDHVNSLVKSIDVVVALESRGFLLGPVIALHLRVPFVPIRKPGKLPGNVQKIVYELEYGSDSFEIQTDSISDGQRVLIVDDLLATGGSLEAAIKLLTNMGAKVAECFVIMELCDLKGKSKLNAPVFSLNQLEEISVLSDTQKRRKDESKGASKLDSHQNGAPIEVITDLKRFVNDGRGRERERDSKSKQYPFYTR